MVSGLQEYLTEAQFSANTLDKVLTILEKRARANLGMIYRYGGPEASVDQKLEVLSFFKDKASGGNLKDINMRVFVNALNLVKSGIPDWCSLLKYT